jgi:hypothetical protein
LFTFGDLLLIVPGIVPFFAVVIVFSNGLLSLGLLFNNSVEFYGFVIFLFLLAPVILVLSAAFFGVFKKVTARRLPLLL